ncbi:PPOX class F420-dependent oxidoreductase [Nocardia arthritidis]|uniref:PPOX class F420-dependent oxidoreductase n=1 Tax=Nocardia arthritidis TaxID=228602 RepID=A0A6G9YNX4_9NOCA|nr:PPOX class F420-dependent oxidoreductase [Nocardia arthritidis]QIS14726.1 PPOX class F420-dependent oxidoreductase [Nocardia arthritidis]
MTFTDAERAYLAGQSLGRLATVTAKGAPQARPVAFQLNTDGTIDIGGPDMTNSQKYRNLQKNPQVSLVVDDMTPNEPGEVKPGWGRGVEVRGVAELLTVEVPPIAPEFFSKEIIRIHPRRISSWHIDPADPQGGVRSVGQ